MFYVAGGILAGWALLVSFLGITQEDFPKSAMTARLVGAISLVLVAAAIFTAIYTGITEEAEHEDEPPAAVLLPLRA